MAKSFSFDIASEFDISELDHAVDQARKELMNRYDFKGTAAKLQYADDKKTSLQLEGDSQYQLQALIEMVRGKFAKRNLSQKILDTTTKPEQAGMVLRWTIPFQSGLDKDKAKIITKAIRDAYPKMKTQIQGEVVRVTGASKDELQSAMTLIKDLDIEFPINFTNFR